MGVFQDLVIWIRRQFGKLTSGRAKHFKFNKEHKSALTARMEGLSARPVNLTLYGQVNRLEILIPG